jgi:hypothetical protein
LYTNPARSAGGSKTSAISRKEKFIPDAINTGKYNMKEVKINKTIAGKNDFFNLVNLTFDSLYNYFFVP